MNIRQQLFGSSGDFLAHTLAHSKQGVGRREGFLADGTNLILHTVGILEIIPANAPTVAPLPKLILSAGVHGNETAPIEFCNTLVNEVIDAVFTIKAPTLIIFGNPEAMVSGERFIEHNMNRLFCGKHTESQYSGSVDAIRAAQIEVCVSDFVEAKGTSRRQSDTDEKPCAVNHYDLHTAIRDSAFEKFAIYPYIAGRSTNSAQLQFLAFSGVEAFLFQSAPATTFSSHTATFFGAESFTVELGKVKPFGENDLSRYQEIIQNLRCRLKGEWPVPRKAEHRIQCFVASHEIINTGKGFKLNIPEDVSNFTEYPVGSVIWEDSEHCYTVRNEPEFIVFPNSNVGTGERAGIMLKRVNMAKPSTASNSQVLH